MDRQGHTFKKEVQVLLSIVAVVHGNCQMCERARGRGRQREKKEGT